MLALSLCCDIGTVFVLKSVLSLLIRSWHCLCSSDIGVLFVDRLFVPILALLFVCLYFSLCSEIGILFCWPEVGAVFVAIWHYMQATPKWFWRMMLAARSPQDSFPWTVQGKTTHLSTKLNSQKNQTRLPQKSYSLFQEQSCHGQIIMDFFSSMARLCWLLIVLYICRTVSQLLTSRLATGILTRCGIITNVWFVPRRSCAADGM